MSLLETLQLVGYSLGAVLPLWMGWLLLKERLGRVAIQPLLLLLALSMAGWHASNLLLTLLSLLNVDLLRLSGVARVADTLAVVSITFCYSLLLHVHLHFWAKAHSRELLPGERVRVYLSYAPCLFLVVAVSRIWIGGYQPMLAKLSFFVTPFVVWVAYALAVVSITELLIARIARSKSERRILVTLAFSFVGIAILVVAALAFGLGEGATLGLYLKTFANLGSLLPSALLAYYIYRYRYLELIIKESLIVATFAGVVLVIYLYGIRRLAEWVTAHWGLRAGVVEGLLILALTLAAAPFRRWLERGFRKLFERETALYREVVARVGARSGPYRNLPELLHFIEAETARALALGRVRIVVRDGLPSAGIPLVGAANSDSVTAEDPGWVDSLLETAKTGGLVVLQGDSALRAHGYELGYPLRRDDSYIGLMLVAASPSALTPEARSTLEVLAGQVAVAIEDSRLVEENLRLERTLAERERLAALGQMAASVAHEVKNPLSAIKSIAQVMGEDEGLSEGQARDLKMIVGETDRLSQTVTELLSFARREPPPAAPAGADDLTRAVADFFRADANLRRVTLDCVTNAHGQLNGMQTTAVREALQNLVMNAVQATPPGGRVKIETFADARELVFAVTDGGPGVPVELETRIWEPFFTTRQRGTGLGLAIVRKRMAETGGTARLVPGRSGEGARFELRVPSQYHTL